MLKITETKVFVSNFDTGSGVGYGMITFNEALVVKFTIIKSGKDGRLFISWPQKKKADGDYVALVTFTSMEAKDKIGDHIVSEFNKKMGITNGGKASEKKVDVVMATNPVVKDAEEAKKDSVETAEKSPGKKTITWG